MLSVILCFQMQNFKIKKKKKNTVRGTVAVWLPFGSIVSPHTVLHSPPAPSCQAVIQTGTLLKMKGGTTRMGGRLRPQASPQGNRGDVWTSPPRSPSTRGGRSAICKAALVQTAVDGFQPSVK